MLVAHQELSAAPGRLTWAKCILAKNAGARNRGFQNGPHRLLPTQNRARSKILGSEEPRSQRFTCLLVHLACRSLSIGQPMRPGSASRLLPTYVFPPEARAGGLPCAGLAVPALRKHPSAKTWQPRCRACVPGPWHPRPGAQGQFRGRSESKPLVVRSSSSSS